MLKTSPPQGFEPNPALRLVYSFLFDSIRVDNGWVRDVREMAQIGSVVYVLRNLNPVDFLALDHLTKRYDLPRVRFVSDLPWGVAHPLRGDIFQRISGRASSPEQLRAAIDDGGSAALFLKRPPNVIDVAAG